MDNNKTEFWICPHCGGHLMWDNDYSMQDMGMDGYEDDIVAICTDYHCAQCGAAVTIWDPNKQERKNYPYWQGVDDDNEVDNPTSR